MRKKTISITIISLFIFDFCLPGASIAEMRQDAASVILRPLAIAEVTEKNDTNRAGKTRRQFLRELAALAGAAFTGRALESGAQQIPQQITPKAQLTARQQALLKSSTLAEYFNNLNQLSPQPSWENSSGVYLKPTDMDLNPLHRYIKNLGGTMVGVSFQQNFTFGIHGNFFTVIDDINPIVTEVFVPFMGYVVEQRKSRIEIISVLTGVPLEKLKAEDVRRLFEPTSEDIKDIGLREYLLNTLQEIVSRATLEERQQWYNGYLFNVLEHQVFDRLRKSGRVPNEKDLNMARMAFADFLEPGTLLDEKIETVRLAGKSQGKFVDFIMYHAAASLETEDKLGTWMSSEQNCERFRNFWSRGNFIGMTADLTNVKAMAPLGHWLVSHGKPEITFSYESNVGEWVGFKVARQMHNHAIGQLPHASNALSLVSHGGPYLRSRILSFQALTHFYNYVDARDRLVPRWLLSYVGTVMNDKEKFYKKFLVAFKEFVGEEASFLESLDSEPHMKKMPDGSLVPALSKMAEAEYDKYKKLTERMKQPEIATILAEFNPDQFVVWAKENSPGLDTGTDYFRAFVWNLTDAGIIQPWPKEYKWERPEKDIKQEIAELITILEDTAANSRMRRCAAASLGEMELEAQIAVSALSRAFEKSDNPPFMRLECVQALRKLNKLGVKLEEAIPALLKVGLSKDTHRRLREEAIFMLKEMGAKAKPALLQMQEHLLKEKDPLNQFIRDAIKTIELPVPDMKEGAAVLLGLSGSSDDKQTRDELRKRLLAAVPKLKAGGIPNEMLDKLISQRGSISDEIVRNILGGRFIKHKRLTNEDIANIVATVKQRTPAKTAAKIEVATGLLSEEAARRALLDEQRYLDKTFLAHEQSGIYKKYKLKRPQVPKIQFRKVEGEDKCSVFSEGDRLTLVFDLSKITDTQDLILLYWAPVADWYFKHITAIYDKSLQDAADMAAEAAHLDSYLATMGEQYISKCGIRETDTVLDIGTRDGWMAILAARLTKNRVLGIDISQVAIEKARQNAQTSNATNVDFALINVLDLSNQLSPNSIDVAISNYTFTSLPPMLRFIALSEIFKVVKKGINIWEYPAEGDPYYRTWTSSQWAGYLASVGFINTKLIKFRQDGKVIAYFIQAEKPQMIPAPMVPSRNEHDEILSTI